VPQQVKLIVSCGEMKRTVVMKIKPNQTRQTRKGMMMPGILPSTSANSPSARGLDAFQMTSASHLKGRTGKTGSRVFHRLMILAKPRRSLFESINAFTQQRKPLPVLPSIDQSRRRTLRARCFQNPFLTVKPSIKLLIRKILSITFVCLSETRQQR